MKTQKDEWPAGRIFHLSGGARAINADGPTIDLQPATVLGKTCRIQAKSYPSVFGDLQKLGFTIIGVDFYTNQWEVEGKAPPNWRVYDKG